MNTHCNEPQFEVYKLGQQHMDLQIGSLGLVLLFFCFGHWTEAAVLLLLLLEHSV